MGKVKEILIENEDLKEKIKELETEIENLKDLLVNGNF